MALTEDNASRRDIIAGLSASAAVLATVSPAVAQPRSSIAELYREYRRRDDDVCERRGRAGEDCTVADHAWIDEPLHEALRLEPLTLHDFAALVLFGFGDIGQHQASHVVLQTAGRFFEGIAA